MPTINSFVGSLLVQHTYLLGSESISLFFFLFVFQQYSKQLEENMEKFVLGETKILICTNIVESGLDIQNANTIIIQDVHQFGLAQLYQVTMPALYLIYCFFFPPLFKIASDHGR